MNIVGCISIKLNVIIFGEGFVDCKHPIKFGMKVGGPHDTYLESGVCN